MSFILIWIVKFSSKFYIKKKNDSRVLYGKRTEIYLTLKIIKMCRWESCIITKVKAIF